MLASILQLVGAILLGYFIAFRNKRDIKSSVMPVLPIAGQKYEKELEKHIETYAYRI